MEAIRAEVLHPLIVDAIFYHLAWSSQVPQSEIEIVTSISEMVEFCLFEALPFQTFRALVLAMAGHKLSEDLKRFAEIHHEIASLVLAELRHMMEDGVIRFKKTDDDDEGEGKQK
jgi:hypothetical protein